MLKLWPGKWFSWHLIRTVTRHMVWPNVAAGDLAPGLETDPDMKRNLPSGAQVWRWLMWSQGQETSLFWSTGKLSTWVSRDCWAMSALTLGSHSHQDLQVVATQSPRTKLLHGVLLSPLSDSRPSPWGKEPSWKWASGSRCWGLSLPLLHAGLLLGCLLPSC